VTDGKSVTADSYGIILDTGYAFRRTPVDEGKARIQ
jgi:hypothetical protein